MYRITAREDGDTAATFKLEPYRFTMRSTRHATVQTVLSAAEDVQQMNRTAAEEDAGEDSTSFEGYQDPSPDFRVGHIATALREGYTVTEVDEGAAVEVSDSDMEFLQGLLDEVTGDDTDERTTNLWKSFLNRVVLRAFSKINQADGEAEEATIEFGADWNPSLHPRDPRTGQFIERPFDVPEELLDMETPDVVRELASSDPDFGEKVQGLQIDMDEDLQELVDEVAGETDVPDDVPGDDADVPEAGDAPEADVPDSDAGELLDTPSIEGRLDPENVEYGDEVTVRDQYGDVWDGRVTGTLERDDGVTLADVEKGDGSGSSLVGPTDARIMFEQGADVEGLDNVVPEEVEQGDIITVQRPDGDDVTGYMDMIGSGEMLVKPVEHPSSGDGLTNVPIGELTDPDASMTRYPDAERLIDVPGVDPLPAEEGGLNPVPDDASPREMVNAIRTDEEYQDAAGRGIHGSPIDDAHMTDTRDVLAPILYNANDEDIAQEYARRTAIGNKANRASNGSGQTPLGRGMNFMTLDDGELSRHSDRVARHEMGHGLMQIRGWGSNNTSEAWDNNHWSDNIDPTDHDDFQRYLMGNSAGVSTEGDGKPGWEEWAEDLRAQFEIDFEDVDELDGEEVETGDVLQLERSPFRLDDTVVEVFGIDDDASPYDRELWVRNEDGGEDKLQVRSNGDISGAGSVEGIARGFSDIEDDSQFSTPDTRFTERGDDVTVDEFRDQLDAEDWQEKIDTLARESNRAYYKMWLKKHHPNREEPIRTGYSSTTADEVPSELHEMLQGESGGTGQFESRIQRLADNYPRLVGTYMELFDPSEDARDVLADVDGVTV